MNKSKSKELARLRPNLQRDLEIARERFAGKSVAQIAEERGMSTWNVYKILEHADVREAQRGWLEYILHEQRELGPDAVEALRGLIRSGDSQTVNAYFKRMGPPEPIAEIPIEKLEIKFSPEALELARRLNPPPDESAPADGNYRCPACSYSTADIGQLGDHIQAAHCQKPTAEEREAEIRSFRKRLASIDEELGDHVATVHRSESSATDEEEK
jgi:hypothetical protein